MRPDQERVSSLIVSTVIKLCEKGLNFSTDIKIEGVIGITVDARESFVVHVNKILSSNDCGYNTSSIPTSRISSSNNLHEPSSSGNREGAISVGSTGSSMSGNTSDRTLIFSLNIKEEKDQFSPHGNVLNGSTHAHTSNSQPSTSKDIDNNLHFFSTYDSSENVNEDQFFGGSCKTETSQDVSVNNQFHQTSSNYHYNNDETLTRIKSEAFQDIKPNIMAESNQLKNTGVIEINYDDGETTYGESPQQQQHSFAGPHPQMQNISRRGGHFQQQEMGFKSPASQQLGGSSSSSNMKPGFPNPQAAMSPPPNKQMRMSSPVKQQVVPTTFLQTMTPQQLQPMRMKSVRGRGGQSQSAMRGRGTTVAMNMRGGNPNDGMALVPVQQQSNMRMFGSTQQQSVQPRARIPQQAQRMRGSSVNQGSPMVQQRMQNPMRGMGGPNAGVRMAGRGASSSDRGGGMMTSGGRGGGNVTNQVVECQSGEGFSFNKQLTVLSRYSCNLCGKIYKNQRSVLHHQSQVHGRPKVKRKKTTDSYEEEMTEDGSCEGYEEGGEEGYYEEEYEEEAW